MTNLADDMSTSLTSAPKVAVFCVGNRLMMDDGVGPAVYDEALKHWDIPENVDFFDVGCLTMDLVTSVNEYDTIITVDAVDGEDDEPGTVYRFSPDDMARREWGSTSLHDLKLADLFDMAALLGYSCNGVCLGMQVENPSPSEFVMDLTPKVKEKLPFLVEVLMGELARLGCPAQKKEPFSSAKA